MNGSTALVVAVVAIIVAIVLYVLHKRSSAATASSVAAVKAVPALVAGHVESATNTIKSKIDSAVTVMRTDLAKAVATIHAAPTPLPVVATTSEPAPAAPAVSAAVEPPPATVAPATPPAAPAPSAGGSGTEHTLNVGVVEEHVRNQYLSLDFADKLPAGSVTLPDAEYIVKMGPAFRAALGTLPNVQLQFAILSGTQAAINLAMDHALQDIARTLKFDPATYTGPLKARYAALVEGVHSGAIKPVSLYSDTGTTS